LGASHIHMVLRYLLQHLQRMRSLYAERQQTMNDALSRATHGAIQLLPSLRGVHLVALSAFCMTSPRRGWAFGYAAYDALEMQRAAKRLAKLLLAAKRD